jgi:predicted nucleic acid-binding protein
MRIYAESSAVAAWLLYQAPDRGLHEALAGAKSVAVSDLTLIECRRALVRASTSGAITESEALERASALEAAAVHWHVVRIAGDVVERAARPFPVEPVRTLDAIHLASALLARKAMPGLKILSLDERVRENAKALGFDLVPEV